MPKLSEEAQTQRRNRILDAAERCFVRSGFNGATMQDIRREAGVSAGALYVYFRSKEDLIEGLSRRDRAQARRDVKLVAEADDIVAGLALVLNRSAIEYPIEKVRFYMDMSAQADRSPALSRCLRECDAVVCSALEDTLSQALARGQIRPLMPIPELTRFMIMMVEGLFWRRCVDPHFDAAAMGPHILRMFGVAMGVEQLPSSPTPPERPHAPPAAQTHIHSEVAR